MVGFLMSSLLVFNNQIQQMCKVANKNQDL